MKAEEYVNRERSRSSVSEKLFSLLLEVTDDLENLCGIFADLQTDEERQLLIDYIEKGEDVNEEQLILNSIWIAQQNDH